MAKKRRKTHVSVWLFSASVSALLLASGSEDFRVILPLGVVGLTLMGLSLLIGGLDYDD